MIENDFILARILKIIALFYLLLLSGLYALFTYIAFTTDSTFTTSLTVWELSLSYLVLTIKIVLVSWVLFGLKEDYIGKKEVKLCGKK